jgi:hypothetical protein
VRGQCLCGRVVFEVVGKMPMVYQCHCSLCRKQSGSTASAGTAVPHADFRWLQGKELVSSWVKDSGFRSDFCSSCGSPVPNPLRDLAFMWVPAGLLEDDGRLAVGIHLFAGSRASWDAAPMSGIVHETAPELHAFVELLQLGAKA